MSGFRNYCVNFFVIYLKIDVYNNMDCMITTNIASHRPLECHANSHINTKFVVKMAGVKG